MGSASDAALKAWATRRKKLVASGLLAPKRRKLKTTIKVPQLAVPKVLTVAKKKPTEKGRAAAKKAWETRRAKAEDPKQAEAERLEAIRILDELAKQRPPVSETDDS